MLKAATKVWKEAGVTGATKIGQFTVTELYAARVEMADGALGHVCSINFDGTVDVISKGKITKVSIETITIVTYK